MSQASDQAHSGYQPGSPRQRLISSVLSGTIITVVVLLAIYQTQVIAPMQERRKNPVTFDMKDSDEGKKAAEKEKKAEKSEKKREKKKQEKAPEVDPVKVEKPEVVVPRPVLVPVKRPTPVEPPAFTFKRVTKAEMAAADIGAIKPSGGGAGASSGASSSGSGSGRSYGPGEGPGGATLYNAEWHRRPTSAELAGYLPPKSPPDGWGLIACQTLAGYRVDNCQILGESPRGSGFGRAALNAAWQFQVNPPRVDGKAQIGAWVRIRIDYQSRPATTL